MNTINELLDRYASEHNNDDVDLIIAHIRKTLASYDAGTKPKREAGSFNMEDVLKNISASRSEAPKSEAPKPAAKGKGFRRI